MSGKDVFPNSVSDIPDSFLYCKRSSRAAFSMSKICCSFIGTLLFPFRISGKKPYAYLFGIFLDMKNNSAYTKGQGARSTLPHMSGQPPPRNWGTRAACVVAVSNHFRDLTKMVFDNQPQGSPKPARRRSVTAPAVRGGEYASKQRGRERTAF